MRMVFYLLYPYLLGHSFYNPKDIPFLFAWIVSTYICIEIFLKVLRRETTYNNAKFEIEKSISDINHNTSIKCNTFAFPNGNYNFQLIKIIKKLLNVTEKLVVILQQLEMDGYMMDRIEIGIRLKKVLVLKRLTGI